MKKFIQLPELGGHELAYNINGDAFVVDAFCYVDGGAPAGVNSLEDLLREYDWSHAIREEIASGRLSADDIIVGVHALEDEDDRMAAIWGEELRYK